MRTGIAISLIPADHARLTEVVADRNSPQKHVWGAQAVLLSAQGVGTNEIMRATGKAKTCVWRWQERFMVAGVEGCCGTGPAPRTSRRSAMPLLLRSSP